MPDMILINVDLHSSGAGYEVCKNLKSNAKTAKIPIIFLSGNRESRDERFGLEIGAVDFISTPVEPTLAMARINTHLQLYANIQKLIASVLNLCNDIFARNHIQIGFGHIDDVEYPLIPTEFKHIFINLINNAKDAFNENDINQHVRKLTFEIIQHTKNITVTVTDNAGGIPEEIIDKIFEPNFTSKSPGKGTGVGLYMSKRIIDKLQGKLYVKNHVNGTKFFIEL